MFALKTLIFLQMLNVVVSCPIFCTCNRITIRGKIQMAWNCGHQELSERQLNLLTDDQDIPIVDVLFLNDNNLTSFPSKYFENFTNLESLYLDGNYIEFIPLHLERYLSKLTFLSLTRNRIVDIGRSSFSVNNSLQELNISNNMITSVPSRTFLNLESLKILDISENKILKLDQESFYGLKMLTTLVASKNSIKMIDNGVFNHTESLTILNLAGNDLSHIYKPMVTSLLNLQHVDFSDNSIATIECNSFKGMNLKSLSLADNHIDNLESKCFLNVSIEKVNIERNQLKCDCNLKSFYKILQKSTHNQTSFTGKCVKPLIVSQLSMEDVLPKLDCSINCDQRVCLNSGECVLYANTTENSTLYQFKCKCTDRFQGLNCAEKRSHGNSKKVVITVVIVLVVVIVCLVVVAVVVLLWRKKRRSNNHTDKVTLTDDDFAI